MATSVIIDAGKKLHKIMFYIFMHIYYMHFFLLLQSVDMYFSTLLKYITAARHEIFEFA